MTKLNKQTYFDKIDAFVGKNIWALRKQAKISQTELGQILGLHQSAVSRIERGMQSIAISQLYKISKLFKKPMTDFFNEDTV